MQTNCCVIHTHSCCKCSCCHCCCRRRCSHPTVYQFPTVTYSPVAYPTQWYGTSGTATTASGGCYTNVTSGISASGAGSGSFTFTC